MDAVAVHVSVQMVKQGSSHRQHFSAVRSFELPIAAQVLTLTLTLTMMLMMLMLPLAPVWLALPIVRLEATLLQLALVPLQKGKELLSLVAIGRPQVLGSPRPCSGGQSSP